MRQKGFTLIEIMVVVFIIGLLASLILPNLGDQQDRALQVKAKADIRSISGQLALYKLDNFVYPNTSQGLNALVENIENTPNWRGYLKKVPKDPWGNPYQYKSPGDKNSDFDLFSYGSDAKIGGSGSAADIGNWEE